MASNKVLVIGGTGAQGAAVIKQLVQDKKYTVRVLTRDPSNRRAKELEALGNVELVKGDLMNEADLFTAFKGVDLAFVNIDGFAIGEKAEVYWGMRIYEIAKETGTVKHYVWGSLDYGLLKGNYNPKYRCGHYDGKGRITQWLQVQPKGNMIWSALTSGPYMDMLFEFLRPFPQPDGSFVFAAPIGNGAVPLIALEDLGYYGQFIDSSYLFDHPEKSAGLDLEIATQDVSWQELATTFTEVTGKPAVFKDLTLEMENKPTQRFGTDTTGLTWRENFSGWWNLWHDRIIKRDYQMLAQIHPEHLTLKSWMIKNKYDGNPKPVLKLIEDGVVYAKQALAPPK